MSATATSTARDQPPAAGDPYPAHARAAGDVVEQLGTDTGGGLADDEVERRRTEHGPNALETEERTSRLQLVWNQLNNVLVWVLVVAAAVSGVALQQWVEAGVISAIVVLNTVLGYVQEARAEEALASLRRLAAPEATVVRAGRTRTVKAEELVPGDVLVLEAGHRVGADARLVEGHELTVDEAVLTGESFPVAKGTEPVDAEAGVADQTSMVFMGTAVQSGRARAVVTATGGRTAMGDIAGMLAEERGATPLQRDLDRMGHRLTALAVLVAAGIFGFGLLRGFAVESLFLTVVALAVAAIPEGLPAVVTITLASGVRRMARQRAIVRRLTAVEALGSASVICSDKTGTLTRNRIRVQRLALGGEVRDVDDLDAADPVVERYLQVAAVCNDASLDPRGQGDDRDDDGTGDPTEVALLLSVRQLGADVVALRDALPRVAEIGFSSDRKRMTTAHEGDDGPFLALKGAPEVVLERVGALLTVDGPQPLDDPSELEDQEHELAAAGLRTLALAYRPLDGPPADDDLEDLERDLVLVALVGMSDEIRPEVPDAVAEAHHAGIEVVLVTGDHRDTAEAVARAVGIAGGDDTVEVRSLAGRELNERSADDLASEVEQVRVYARVDPRDKVKIVKAWQSKGGIIAMTGDGVNDAPALQAADIGVAMGSGTEVAKDSGDIVLTDDNFATIVGAVREGRRIFTNIRRVVHFLVSANLAEILVVAIGVLAFGELGEPLLPTQILWINLITDGLPVVALGIDPAAPDVMARPPARQREILGRRQLGRLSLDGAVLAGAALAAFAYGHLARSVPFGHTRTLVFTTLALVQLVQLYNLRADERSLFRAPPTGNRLLAATVLASVALQVAVVQTAVGGALFDTVAIPPVDWAVIAGLLAAAAAGLDALKRVAGPLGRPG